MEYIMFLAGTMAGMTVVVSLIEKIKTKKKGKKE